MRIGLFGHQNRTGRLVTDEVRIRQRRVCLGNDSVRGSVCEQRCLGSEYIGMQEDLA